MEKFNKLLGMAKYHTVNELKYNKEVNYGFIFEYLNVKRTNNMERMLPHIVHYYILYVHHYMDYNGRCARVVSLWIMLLRRDTFYYP